MGNGKHRPLKKWEKDYLIENYGELTFSEMSEYLDVSSQYIRSKLVEMGIHHVKRHDDVVGGFDKLDISELFKCKFKLELNKTYTIIDNGDILSGQDPLIATKRIFTGKLIQLTNELIVLDNGYFKECVRKIDLLTGDYTIKEVN